LLWPGLQHGGVASSADHVKVSGLGIRLDEDVFGPHSSHAGKGFVPEGGNFIFEDGLVSWYPFNAITLGLKANLTPGTYHYFYKIPTEGQ
jgi:hypothetical protein